MKRGQATTAVLVSGAAQRVRRSAGEWSKLIEQQRSSGLSQEAFCRARGISSSAWWLWRKRLGAAASIKPMQAAHRNQRSAVAQFVELPNAVMAPLVSPPQALKIRFDLGGGMTLEISRP
jgi:putative transposase